MSLILEALRKMEQERKAKLGAAQNLRPEVLRYRGAAGPQQGRPYLVWAVGAALVLSGVGAGAFFMGKRGAVVSEHGLPGKEAAAVAAGAASASAGSPLPAAAPTVAAPSAAAAPAPAAPSVSVPQAASSAPALPLKGREKDDAASEKGEDRAVPVRGEGRAVAGRAGAGAALKGGGDRASRRDADEAKNLPSKVGATRGRAREMAPAPGEASPVAVRTEANVRPKPAAAALQPAPADISVSGIAYQDERNLRRAVVNGMLVKEGEMVAGARVVEIKETKVRMSRGGQLFDVVHSSEAR